VKYTNDAIKQAVELSSRYINDRKLPDKAIDVIDETGASQMLLPEDKRKKTIDVGEIEDVIATMARIPPKTVSKSMTRNCRQDLDVELKRVSLWPGQAIDCPVAAIKLARAGLARTGQADRLLPVLRPDRRRQDGSGQAAGRKCWASRCCASTCRNTWSGTRSRG
jgi:ATP-dependent Clp protease ATP-binding subunit ClpA